MIALAFPLAVVAGLVLGALASLIIRNAARVEAKRAAELDAWLIDVRRKAIAEAPAKIRALEARASDLRACGQVSGADYYASQARGMRRRLEFTLQLAA